jgi:hypothetical protein
VREPLRHHAARLHLLQSIVANRRRGANRFVGITWIELDAAGLKPSARRRRMSPHARKAIGLQLHGDRRALAEVEHVLDVVAELVRDHVRLREIAGSAEPPRQLAEEAEIEATASTKST